MFFCGWEWYGREKNDSIQATEQNCCADTLRIDRYRDPSSMVTVGKTCIIEHLLLRE